MSPVRHPRLAVSVGVWRGDDVLLIRRARPPMQQLWTFPGGGVEPGETLVEAARRELAEETGLHADPVGEPLSHEIILRDDAGVLTAHAVLLVFAARVGPEAMPVAADDAAEARFFPRAALAGLETTPRLMHFVEETFRRLATSVP